VDSKGVSAAIKADIWPRLRDAGFSRFADRKAWRYQPTVIQVVDLPALGSHQGSRVSVTPWSFSATVGVYYTAVHHVPWVHEPVPEQPAGPTCQARRALRKEIFQWKCWRPDVWYVDRRGANLPRVMAALRSAFGRQALPWLEDMSTPSQAISAFERKEEAFARGGIAAELLGGALDSLARAEVVSALALEAGDISRAAAAWHRLLANPYYAKLIAIRQRAESNIRMLEAMAAK
jgi:hypothetical protein